MNRATKAGSNVVPIRPRKRTGKEIADGLASRRVAMEREILVRLTAAADMLEGRYNDTLACLVPLGRKMDMQTLTEWLEVGQHMIGQRGRT